MFATVQVTYRQVEQIEIDHVRETKHANKSSCREEQIVAGQRNNVGRLRISDGENWRCNTRSGPRDKLPSIGEVHKA